jgi:hypothetical protein
MGEAMHLKHTVEEPTLKEVCSYLTHWKFTQQQLILVQVKSHLN